MDALNLYAFRGPWAKGISPLEGSGPSPGSSLLRPRAPPPAASLTWVLRTPTVDNRLAQARSSPRAGRQVLPDASRLEGDFAQSGDREREGRLVRGRKAVSSRGASPKPKCKGKASGESVLCPGLWVAGLRRPGRQGLAVAHPKTSRSGGPDGPGNPEGPKPPRPVQAQGHLGPRPVVGGFGGRRAEPGGTPATTT